eukprot:m.796514 g.796514  ORF g.796514 m.796514 type:complete len:443 (+) comp23344_c0_seq9:523-1851(+)
MITISNCNRRCDSLDSRSRSHQVAQKDSAASAQESLYEYATFRSISRENGGTQSRVATAALPKVAADGISSGKRTRVSVKPPRRKLPAVAPASITLHSTLMQRGTFKQFHVAVMTSHKSVGRCRPRTVVLRTYARHADNLLCAEGTVYAFLPRRVPHLIRCLGTYRRWGLILEHAPLGSLRTRLPRIVADVTPAHDVEMLTQICRAMEALDRAGVVHGNLTLGNVLLCAFDRERPSATLVKVSNLSRARMLGASICMPAALPVEYNDLLWMAPELRRSGQCSVGSDVWSYGIAAVELLTRGETYGKNPTGKTLAHTFAAGIATLDQEGSGHVENPLGETLVNTASTCFDDLWHVVRTRFSLLVILRHVASCCLAPGVCLCSAWLLYPLHCIWHPRVCCPQRACCCLFFGSQSAYRNTLWQCNHTLCRADAIIAVHSLRLFLG